MQDIGGLESASPDEGSGGASEALSEEAKARFAQAQQHMKQIIREEKKARKRDDRVAQTIRQFLGDEKYSHLFQLISRLVARDCPSVFILALLSLIHAGSREAVEEFVAERKIVIETGGEKLGSWKQSGLPPESRERLLLWITRLELILSVDAERILSKLMVDDGNIDGTVLQLTTFVLVDFFAALRKPIPYDQLQPFTIKILQDIIEPYMGVMEEYFAKRKEEMEGKKDDEE